MNLKDLPGFEAYLEQRKKGSLSIVMKHGRMPDDEPTLPAWVVDELANAYAAGRLSVLGVFAITPHKEEALRPVVDIEPTAPPIEIRANLNGPTRGGRVFEKGPELKKVGFWREARKPMGEMFHMTYGQGPIESSYPDVNDFVDAMWRKNHFDEYTTVVAYLMEGQIKDAYKGSSQCRICGKTNGSCDITDGVWVWPEGFLHYIVNHDVKPPQEFVDYVTEKMKEYKGT